MKTQIAPLEVGANATGHARLLYAEAELQKLRKHDAEAGKIYDEIGARFKPEELSPVLLAMLAIICWPKATGRRLRASTRRCEDDFPKSDYLDFAFAGLGEIALGTEGL